MSRGSQSTIDTANGSDESPGDTTGRVPRLVFRRGEARLKLELPCLKLELPRLKLDKVLAQEPEARNCESSQVSELSIGFPPETD